MFPGVFGGYFIKNISLPEDANLCGYSQWSRLQKQDKYENNFWGECHNSRAPLASQRASAGLCGLLSSPSDALPAAAGFFRYSLSFPVSLSHIQGLFLPPVPPEPPHFWHGSCSWSLPFPPRGTERAQISMGKEQRSPSSPAESLLTIWGSKLPICSLTRGRPFVVETDWIFSDWQKQKPSPKHFLLKPEVRSGPAISLRHKTYFDRKLIFFQSFQHAPPFNQPSTPLAAPWTRW